MSTPKRTPGPWQYDGMWSLVKAGEAEIAAIHAARDLPKRKGEALANAHLIAAAPELLEALKRVILDVDNPGSDIMPRSRCTVSMAAQQQAREAIAKAQG